MGWRGEGFCAFNVGRLRVGQVRYYIVNEHGYSYDVVVYRYTTVYNEVYRIFIPRRYKHDKI